MSVGIEDKAVGKRLRSRSAVQGLQIDHELTISLTPVYLIINDVCKSNGGLFFRCTQPPLVPASGVTIHHCQGSTFVQVGVDMVKLVEGRKLTIKEGMVYTACSRTNTLEGFHLMNLDEADIKTDHQVVKEMQRLFSTRLNVQSCPSMKREPGILSIYNHNLGSFHKHHPSMIMTSSHFALSDTCCLQETGCSLAEFPASASVPGAVTVEIPYTSQGPHGIAFVASQNSHMHPKP